MPAHHSGFTSAVGAVLLGASSAVESVLLGVSVGILIGSGFTTGGWLAGIIGGATIPWGSQSQTPCIWSQPNVRPRSPRVKRTVLSKRMVSIPFLKKLLRGCLKRG